MTSAPLISATSPIVLASRASQLALAQAHEVRDRLAPHAAEIKTFSTRGDEVLDRSLAAIGGKGLFVKTLEAAMLAGEADAAVHSSKDMETRFADGTELAAFLPREDRRDALIGAYSSFDELPQGAVVGTASVRRAAIIASIRPDVTTRLLRGNVNSRLKQLEDGHYDAIILAMAGMKRLGITADIHPIEEEMMLPSSAQGAIAIQAVADDGTARRAAVLTALRALDDADTAVEVTAERALLAELDGTCRTPIAASAHLRDGRVTMRAQLLSLDGKSSFNTSGDSLADEAAAMAIELAQDLLRQAGGK
ncbi:MAG: hydroxymethylbilane synthase, partial [Alphaproteobacteria bacterium]|nr:hydroxymethylbilane synthase [Alphaproteobacteria bacterium]